MLFKLFKPRPLLLNQLRANLPKRTILSREMPDFDENEDVEKIQPCRAYKFGYPTPPGLSLRVPHEEDKIDPDALVGVFLAKDLRVPLRKIEKANSIDEVHKIGSLVKLETHYDKSPPVHYLNFVKTIKLVEIRGVNSYFEDYGDEDFYNLKYNDMDKETKQLFDICHKAMMPKGQTQIFTDSLKESIMKTNYTEEQLKSMESKNSAEANKKICAVIDRFRLPKKYDTVENLRAAFSFLFNFARDENQKILEETTAKGALIKMYEVLKWINAEFLEYEKKNKK